MPDVYGNDFSSLQSGVTADASMRQRGLESALNSALSAMAQMKQRQMLSDQFTQRLAAEKEQYKQHADFLEQSRLDKQAIEEAQAPMREKQMDLMDAEIAKMKESPQKQRSDALRDSYAYSAATQGQDVSDIEGIDPTTRQILGKISTGAAAGKQAGYDRANALAAALTRADLLQEKVDNSKKAAADIRTNRHFWNPFSWDYGNNADTADEDAKAAQAKLDALNRRLSIFKQDKNLMETVQPNPKTGAWEPAVTPPPAKAAGQTLDTSGTTNRRSYGVGNVPNRRPNFTVTPDTSAPAPVTKPGPVQDPDAAPMMTAPTTSTGTAGSKRDWVIGRAKELTDTFKLAPADAVARARAEYDANP